MCMKRVCRIAFGWFVAIAALFVVSCSNETDTTLNTQQKSIQNYLTGSHQPKLVAEEDLAHSLDEEPQFYTHWGLDIFRYISTYYDDDRSSKPQAEAGDKVEIMYSAYIFTNGKPSISNLFATNVQASIDQLTALGLNTSYEWTTDPFAFTLGGGEILGGLETALEGCREGDKVEVYLTFEAAYGKNHVGMVPSKSAQMWDIEIVSVTKK